jgi:hypothetical protein
MGSSQPKVVETLSCIAVIPAQMGIDEQLARLGGNLQNVRRGAEYADSVLAQELGSNPKVKMVSGTELNMETIGNQDTTINQVSQATGCDGVMVTTVLKFKQREGSTWAVDQPASTAFEMRLYNATTKYVLWSADFAETQESLLSNIFSFDKAQSRGFQWITVEQLFSQGMKERLAECPYL